MDKDEMKKELLEEENLENVTGGMDPGFGSSCGGGTDQGIEVTGRDSKGNPIYFKQNGREFYYACPKCGRILHRGTMGMMYCDPCDDWWAGSKSLRVYR